MAKDLSLNLVRADDGNNVLINDSDIVLVTWDTLGSKITYNDQGANLKEIIVTNSNAAVAALSEVLIDLIDVESGSTMYFNTNRFMVTGGTTIAVGSDTLGTTFTYDTGFIRKVFTVTEDLNVVYNRIANK